MSNSFSQPGFLSPLLCHIPPRTRAFWEGRRGCLHLTHRAPAAGTVHSEPVSRAIPQPQCLFRALLALFQGTQSSCKQLDNMRQSMAPGEYPKIFTRAFLVPFGAGQNLKRHRAPLAQCLVSRWWIPELSHSQAPHPLQRSEWGAAE